MEQYINKAALVAEIDRLQEATMDKNQNFLSSYHEGIFDGLSMLENFLDTLEVKEVKEEPVSNDLEEAARKAGQEYFPNEDNIWARPNYEAKKAECVFKAGAQWQKERLMENAVEAVIHPYDGEIWVDKDLLSIYDDCQRVKLIIIKENKL